MSEKLTDFSRLCVHTMTTKPWSLQEACDAYKAADVAGITVWRQYLEPQGIKESAKILRDSGLDVVSLCRGGFFPATSGADREAARTDNRRAIDEAAEIGAPLVVLVCGAVPGMPLNIGRQQILDGIAAIEPHAKACGVKLAIEPLHPMYADDRSAINTLEQAVNFVDVLDSDWVGLTIDVYHLWWDPMLKAEINRSTGKIFSFHVCDWRTPTRHLLTDRGLMGDGCIDIPEIRGWVEETGFNGPIEVEIFSEELWAADQNQLLKRIKNAYLKHV
jgi:sugar phosphate isomerase/epimerase